jgi:hypothetical protein
LGLAARFALGFAGRCCGGLFATTSTARSKRAHASGCISGFFLGSVFAMPEDYTSPEDEAFFGAIGRLAVSWAHLEIGLDWLVRTIHHDLRGRELIEGIEPIPLKRKLDYLGKAFRLLPELAAFKDRFPPMAEQIRAASVVRHDVIHGFVVQQVAGSGEAIMVRLMPDRKSAKPFSVTTESILRAAVRTNKIYVLRFAEEVALSLRRT